MYLQQEPQLNPSRLAMTEETAAIHHAKLGMAFLLNAPAQDRHVARPQTALLRVSKRAAAAAVSGASTNSRCVSTSVSVAPELTKEEKKRRRQCKVEGCGNYIVHKGLCCRHGGGKKCSLEGCTSSAKHYGLCWKHGGSVKCNENNCNKKAKARGKCWAHGGGVKCHSADCAKVAVSHGLCWAHGGGKRCVFEECTKPAYRRTHNFCVKHYEELRYVDYYEV